LSRTTARIGDLDVRIRLVPDGQITGRITSDRLDTPAKGVTIQAGMRRTSMKPDGSFLLTRLPPGAYYVDFTSPDFLGVSRPQVDVQPGATTDLGIVTMTRSRTLVGRVVDASGSPVGGAKIEVGVIRPDPVDPDDPPAGFHGYRAGVAAPDGTFRISWMPPAPMVAIASDPTYGSSDAIPVPGGPSAPGDPPPITLLLTGTDKP
jgi:hypothetical protein